MTTKGGQTRSTRRNDGDGDDDEEGVEKERDGEVPRGDEDDEGGTTRDDKQRSASRMMGMAAKIPKRSGADGNDRDGDHHHHKKGGDIGEWGRRCGAPTLWPQVCSSSPQRPTNPPPLSSYLASTGACRMTCALVLTRYMGDEEECGGRGRGRGEEDCKEEGEEGR
jgi:hypothetical protein